jgi:2',3'-cyclic-nucleotide 2'-phosphodiesterase (5'-nucleotidase family)
VKDFFDFTANKGGIPVSGLRMKIKNNMAADAMIGDEPFNPSRSYIIATSDDLANGGDGMTFFMKATRKAAIGIKLRNAVMEYLQEENKKGNTIKVKSDGRIQLDK